MLRRDISREWPLMLCIEPLFESFTENMAYIDLQENRCEFTSHDLLQMSTKQCAFFDQTSSLFKFMKWVWITSVRSQLDQNEVAGPPAGANARHAASGPLWSLARVVIGEPDRLLRIPCLQLHGILFRVSGYDMPNHANVYPQYWYQNLVSEWRPRYIHCTAHIARLGAVPRFCRGGPVQMWQGCWMKVAGVSGTCIEQAVEHDDNMIESYIYITCINNLYR